MRICRQMVLLWLTGLLVLAGAATTAHADELVVFPPGGTQLTIPPEGAVTDLLPVEVPEGVEADRLQVALIRLTRGGSPVPGAIREQVALTFDAEAAGLRLTIPEGLLRDQGIYTATVRLSGPEADGAIPRQLVDLQLTVPPPAAISAPTSLEVRQTIGLFTCFPGLCSIEAPPLRLRAGPDTRLSDLLAVPIADRAYQVVAPALTGRQPVELDPPLLAGGVLEVDYELAGDPVLGTQTDVLELSSPQLAQPVRVAFEVTTRRHPSLIVAIVLLGLLAGLLVRVVLTRISAAISGRLTRSEAIARLRALHREIADPAFRRTVSEEIGALEQSGLDGLSQRLAEARQRTDAAVRDVRARQRAAREALLPVQQLLDRGWVLEGAPADALRRARARCEETLGQLDRCDVSGAATSQPALDQAVATLVEESAAAVEAIGGAAGDLAEVDGRAMALDLQPLLARARRMAATAALPADATSADILGALHRLLLDVAALRTDAAASVPLLAGHRAKAVDGEAFDRALSALRSAAADEALPAGRMTAAIAEAVGDLAAQATTTLDTHGEAAAGDAAGLDETSPPPLVEPTRPASPSDRLWGGAGRTLLRLAGTLVEMIRFAVLGLILSLLAYRWFEPGWIGTLGDMMALFTWAFALDVSVEAVRQVAGSRPQVDFGTDPSAAPADPPPPEGAPEQVERPDPAAGASSPPPATDGQMVDVTDPALAVAAGAGAAKKGDA